MINKQKKRRIKDKMKEKGKEKRICVDGQKTFRK